MQSANLQVGNAVSQVTGGDMFSNWDRRSKLTFYNSLAFQACTYCRCRQRVMACARIHLEKHVKRETEREPHIMLITFEHHVYIVTGMLQIWALLQESSFSLRVMVDKLICHAHNGQLLKTIKHGPSGCNAWKCRKQMFSMHASTFILSGVLRRTCTRRMYMYAQ